jgi:pyroglutamyl-peptidase
MQSILLTGFEPFHKASQNPTQEIVQQIAQENLPDVHTLVLPVVFGDVVIMLGQAEGRTAITPEKIAINFDDARIEDNAGNQPKNQKINIIGSDGIFSTLPVEAITNALNNAGIPSNVSLSAGSFVCNHIFYATQLHCQDLNIKSGFIHVPLMESQESEFPGLPTMSLDELVKATKLIIHTCR